MRIATPQRDLFGLGWRPELAAGVLGNLHRVDVVEVIADRLFNAGPSALRALAGVAGQVGLVLHGVSLGLASAAPASERRLAAMARVAGALSPLFWSEHLAFVRGGGVEIGHLTAPPRTMATIEGTARNVERAAARVGARPLLENVATLLAPPGSELAEPEWVAATLDACGCDLLLDLHNLLANSSNFGWDPRALLDRIPASRIAAVHLAGGRQVRGPDGVHRLLDDHRHDIPDAVYQLLAEVGARVPHPLVVIYERDGAYPPTAALLAELDRARAALAQGRARRQQRRAG